MIRTDSFEDLYLEESMRWLPVASIMLSGLVVTGCPSEFGKDGRIAKAVHKDAEEQIIIVKHCKSAERERVCAHGQENSRACLECGGPP